MALPIADRWFEHRSIGEGITLLWEPHVIPLMRCNIWHDRGRDRDLIIDTGMGVASLHDATLHLIDKPVRGGAAGICPEIDLLFIDKADEFDVAGDVAVFDDFISAYHNCDPVNDHRAKYQAEQQGQKHAAGIHQNVCPIEKKNWKCPVFCFTGVHCGGN